MTNPEQSKNLTLDESVTPAFEAFMAALEHLPLEEQDKCLNRAMLIMERKLGAVTRAQGNSYSVEAVLRHVELLMPSLPDEGTQGAPGVDS